MAEPFIRKIRAFLNIVRACARDEKLPYEKQDSKTFRASIAADVQALGSLRKRFYPSPHNLHMLEDYLKNSALRNIAQGQYTLAETRKISQILDQISRVRVTRWYS